MSFLKAILLSLLQGATEFLPVSSSGHLALASQLMEIDPESNVPFAVLVHFGTLIAIVIVFRHDIRRMTMYLLRDGWKETSEKSVKQAWLQNPRGRMILSVMLAIIPTAFTGLLFRDFFGGLYENPVSVGWALIATALLLASTLLFKRCRDDESRAARQVLTFPFWAALLIGCAQAIAIIPGISRSGSTIAVALLLGLHRRVAGEFSFLIAIPVIAGAVALELPDLFEPGSGQLTLLTGLAALLVSTVSGYFFLKLLLRFVQKGNFGYFSIYCFALGLWAIAYFS
ncbi:MAG: undecaprenyl-diphosphate phosphatase [Candidatus Sumerlaeota bacterium]